MYGLDILRSIAILSVVFGHSIWVFYSWVKPGTIYDALFVFATMIGGFFGVELFFVLSGFLIGSIFIRELINHSNQSEPLMGQMKHFWLKRWFRTLPNYYLFVLLYLLLAWSLGNSDWDSFSWKYLVFIQNFTHSGPGFFYVAWSLAVEEWFYLILPLLFAVLLIIIKNRKIAFQFTIALLFVIPFALRITYIILHPQAQQYSLVFNLTTIYRLDSIAYGLGLSWLWSHQQIREWLIQHKSSLIIIGLLSFVAVLGFLFIWIAKPIQHPLLVLLSYPWATLSIALCFPYMISMALQKQTLISNTITMLSKVSYSLYLVHPIVIALVSLLIDKFHLTTIVGINIFSFVAIIVFSIFLAYCFYRFWEQPFLALRERLLVRSVKK